MAAYVEKKGFPSNPFLALQQDSNTVYAELGRRTTLNSITELSRLYNLDNISTTVRSSDLLVKDPPLNPVAQIERRCSTKAR